MSRKVLVWLMAVGVCLLTEPLACALDGLPMLKNYRALRVSSYDRAGGNSDALTMIAPGATVVLADIEGPGMITHIWFTIAAEKFHGRKIVLRIYWDEEQDPSVLCPVNDFFCAGHGINADVRSLPIMVTSNGRARNCFFKMPFNKRARIEITNEGLEHIVAFYYYIDYRKYSHPFDDVGYFHARYRQEYPVVSGRNYLICSAKGTGHFVGCNLSIESNSDGWWGEGDDRFFVDGQAYPSFHGTGSEDYLCDAWGIWPGFSPYYGSTIHEGADYAKGSRYTSYRFHIEDPIPFQKSFIAEIEHYGAKKGDDGKFFSSFAERDDNWSSVAYWYQTEPHEPWGPMSPVEQRLPREAAKQSALLRFLREAKEYTGSGPIEPLRQTYENLAGDDDLAAYHNRATVLMALAERTAGYSERAVLLVAPLAESFLPREFADDIRQLLGEPVSGAARVCPLLVSAWDGSTKRVKKAGRWCIVTETHQGKPYIYFALPENTDLRNLDRTIRLIVSYYCDGQPGNLFQIHYDSHYSDDLAGFFRDSKPVIAPETAGWHSVVVDCPRARFAGHQYSQADFRIAALFGVDVFISSIELELPK